MKKLSDVKINQILELRKKNLTYKQISQYGFSYCVVCKYCKKFLPDIRKRHSNYIDEYDIDLIKRLRSQGLSMPEIKRKTGLGWFSIHRVCNKFVPGVKFARKNMVKRRDIGSMLDYRRKGYSYTRIGRMLGYDPSTVSRNIKRTIGS